MTCCWVTRTTLKFQCRACIQLFGRMTGFLSGHQKELRHWLSTWRTQLKVIYFLDLTLLGERMDYLDTNLKTTRRCSDISSRFFKECACMILSFTWKLKYPWDKFGQETFACGFFLSFSTFGLQRDRERNIKWCDYQLVSDQDIQRWKR